MASRAQFQTLASKLINQTFGDFADPVVVNLNGNPDYATQTTPILKTENTVGIRESFDSSQFDGQAVKQGDYKILIEQQSLTIDLRADNVSMKFNGVDVNIINVMKDAANAVLTVQARDK